MRQEPAEYQDGSRLLRLAVEAMGTRFELALVGSDPVHLQAAGECAIAEILECHRRLSLFRTDSLLSYIHRHAAEGPVRLDGPTFDLFRTALDVHERSGGAFDIALAHAMRAWRLHEGSVLPNAGDVPGMEAGEAAVSKSGKAGAEPGGVVAGSVDGPGMRDLMLDPMTATIRFRRPGVGLDLGAIAKGHALDLAAEVLRSEGVAAALLHGGTSSVLAWGDAPVLRRETDVTDAILDVASNADCLGHRTTDVATGGGWPIAIRVPMPTGGLAGGAGTVDPMPPPAFLRVALLDEALGVSAPHGRMIVDTDQAHRKHSASSTAAPLLGHVLDPRTRRPLPCNFSLVAVIAPTAIAADAWSTALLVHAARGMQQSPGPGDHEASPWAQSSPPDPCTAAVLVGGSAGAGVNVRALGRERFRMIEG